MGSILSDEENEEERTEGGAGGSVMHGEEAEMALPVFPRGALLGPAPPAGLGFTRVSSSSSSSSKETADL